MNIQILSNALVGHKVFYKGNPATILTINCSKGVVVARTENGKIYVKLDDLLSSQWKMSKSLREAVEAADRVYLEAKERRLTLVKPARKHSKAAVREDMPCSGNFLVLAKDESLQALGIHSLTAGTGIPYPVQDLHRLAPISRELAAYSNSGKRAYGILLGKADSTADWVIGAHVFLESLTPDNQMVVRVLETFPCNVAAKPLLQDQMRYRYGAIDKDGDLNQSGLSLLTNDAYQRLLAAARGDSRLPSNDGNAA